MVPREGELTLGHIGHQGNQGIVVSPFLEKVRSRGQGRGLLEGDSLESGGEILLELSGYPPAFLLTMGGSEELLAGSIPIGSALCRPSELERPFPASGGLVLYSDGLPEAQSPAGDPYGYDRLAQVLGECRSFGGGELTAAILGDLDRHAAGTPLADDLTLVIVESGGVGAADGSAPDPTEST